MRTSARNALRGSVETVTEGAVNSEVVVVLPGGVRLSAIITRGSVATLGLAPGREVTALIKASFVIVGHAGEVGRTSAHNALRGTVSRREDGAVSTELHIDVGGTASLVAMITRESANELAFKAGDAVVALIKASHVILAVDD